MYAKLGLVMPLMVTTFVAIHTIHTNEQPVPFLKFFKEHGVEGMDSRRVSNEWQTKFVVAYMLVSALKLPLTTCVQCFISACRLVRGAGCWHGTRSAIFIRFQRFCCTKSIEVLSRTHFSRFVLVRVNTCEEVTCAPLQAP